MQARLERLRYWSRQLDSAFELPGGIRIGWDPIVGLVPGIGDLATPLFSIAVLVTAMQLGVPRVVQLRMLLNVVLDAIVGSVPLVGDAIDAGWKANEWNMELLDRHAWTVRPATTGDWLFVAAIALVMLAAILIPVAVLIIVFHVLGRLLA
jgi:hypothetical protein